MLFGVGATVGDVGDDDEVDDDDDDDSDNGSDNDDFVTATDLVSMMLDDAAFGFVSRAVLTLWCRCFWDLPRLGVCLWLSLVLSDRLLLVSCLCSLW